LNLQDQWEEEEGEEGPQAAESYHPSIHTTLIHQLNRYY
jgi:hypothetical protein